MSNELSSYEAELSMHIQSEDARDFYAKSMAHLNAYVGADINKVLPEALERHIKCLESMRNELEEPELMERIAMDESPFEFLDWACHDLDIFLRWALNQRVSQTGSRIPYQKAYTGRFWDADWDEERFKNVPKLQGTDPIPVTHHDTSVHETIPDYALQTLDIQNEGYHSSGMNLVGSKDERGKD